MSRSLLTARRSALGAVGAFVAVVVLLALPNAQPASAGPAAAPVVNGWTIYKLLTPQPACTGAGWPGFVHFDRLDCGFGDVAVTETIPTSTVKVAFVGSNDAVLETQTTSYRPATKTWRFFVEPQSSWPAGPVRIRVSEVDGVAGNFGETRFQLNALGATVGVEGSPDPGEDLTVSGRVFEIDQMPPLASPQETGVPATFKLRVVRPDGTASAPTAPVTAESDGTFEATIPGAATAGLTAGPDTGYQVGVSIEVVDATYTDPVTGSWVAQRAGAGSYVFTVAPIGLVLQNSFVSAVGWVKPGETYPFRVFVKNYAATATDGGTVTIPAVDGMEFTNAVPAAALASSTSISWAVGEVPAATATGPGVKTLVVEAQADTVAEDSQIVWKNLSTTATLSGGGTSTSLGPKVIPPKAIFDTARYGYRPFPVVPVDYFERKHEPAHTGKRLSDVINSPSVEGSTFNLFQEMSFRQLAPDGTVPSAGIASRGFAPSDGTRFTTPAPQGTCHGATYKDVKGSPVYGERIRDGWYQLPGDTQYYGGDRFGSAVPGAVAGVGLLMDIDSACGPTGKAVYDAAHIADPEIDYSDYDTDKDGVVDFFMMVFTGLGGNGASQLSAPPYDNIWPHSSSLEFYYSDSATGLKGYISNDQLKDLQGRPLWYVDTSRSAMTTENKGDALKVMVRVGPYNVNPESAIDKASVISHEYGHSLGLPDYYSLGSRETYGDWNLMATDKSQHMDVNAKRELGWLVPTVLDSSRTISAEDSKLDTHRIEWKEPDGDPYVLSGPTVHNGESYLAQLPKRLIIDPKKVEEGASLDHVWWSQSGNDYGCPPAKGHNLDVFLPELGSLPAGTPVKVELKSYWDIEWDYDYGFVLTSTDGGTTYQSLPSAKGYTTPASFNPTANSCQAQYGNGITGTSGSYAGGTATADRALGSYPDGGFLADEYSFASSGEETVLRFAYATDPGLARPGWFIDDLKVTAGDTVIYDSNFEQDEDERLFNGGCAAHGRVAAACTDGWQYVSASAGSPADHAYLMEMRDRSSFDFDGRDQNDRDDIQFAPGFLLVYTDEAHGYGNVGTSDPPAQTPLDSQPEPGNEAPNLHDAAFTDTAGDDRYSDSGQGHTDNYTNPSETEVDSRYPDVAHPWRLRFDCLTFDVGTLTGEEGNSRVALDLAGDVAVTVGPGCAPFDYGYNPPVAAPPPAPPVERKPGASPPPPPPGTTPPPPASPGPVPPRTPTGSKLCTITGTPGNDVLVGTGRADGICGLGGNDVIRGLGGNDRLYGGAGNDRVYGGNGRDRIYGATGNDLLVGDAGPDQIAGNPGNDRILGGLGADVIFAGLGNDRVFGGLNDDRIRGESGSDRIAGGKGGDRISAGAGVDLVDGGPGRDRIAGGLHADRLFGREDADLIFGGPGPDRLSAGGGARNTLLGQSGDDVLNGVNGFVDSLVGGSGTDTVIGEQLDLVRLAERFVRKT